MKAKTSNYLLGALIIQNSIAVLIARHVSTNYNYDVRKLLIIAELVKLFLSCILEGYTTQKKNPNHNLCTSLYQYVWLTPLDALKLSIPALLYALQNILAFTAISIVPVPLFLIVQQTKLVKTTLLSILLLRRSYSLVQWISIISLCLGSSICFFAVIYDGKKGDEKKNFNDAIAKEEMMEMEEENGDRIHSSLIGAKFHIFGVLLIVAANFSASLAGVYFELVIKGVDKKEQVDDKIDTDSNDNDVEQERLLDHEEDRGGGVIDEKDHLNAIEMTSKIHDLPTLKLDTSSSSDDDTIIEDGKKLHGEIQQEQILINEIQNNSGKEDGVIIKTTNNEKSSIMKPLKDQPSIWMRNIQLGFFTLCLIAIDFLVEGSKKDNQTPLIGGEVHATVIIQIFLFAFGGLLIAAVIKNADNVQKGLCMGISVVLTCIISMIMDRSIDGISLQFIEGATLAIGGCFFFANSTLISFNKKHCVLYLVFLFFTGVTILFRNDLFGWLPSFHFVDATNSEVHTTHRSTKDIRLGTKSHKRGLNKVFEVVDLEKTFDVDYDYITTTNLPHSYKRITNECNDEEDIEEYDVDRQRSLLDVNLDCDKIKDAAFRYEHDEQFLIETKKSITKTKETLIKNAKNDDHNKDQDIMPVNNNDIHDNLHVIVKTVGTKGLHPNCGGCNILWEFHDTLQAMNISTAADLSGASRCPKNNTFDNEIASGKTLVFVYPETSNVTCNGPGNRVHVRWLLGPPGINIDVEVIDSWNDDDLIFSYSAACALHRKLPTTNILQVMKSPEKGDQSDLSISSNYHHDQKNRTGILWMLRKAYPYRKYLNYIHEGHDLNPITQMEEPQISDFLEYEYFFSYDPFTFYSFTAAMVGTTSIVYQFSNNVTKQTWMEGTYAGEYIRANGGVIPGVAYGWNDTEIEFAKRTMSNLRSFLFDVKEWGKKSTVPRFLRDVYRYSKGERDRFEGGILKQNFFSDDGNDDDKTWIYKYMQSHVHEDIGKAEIKNGGQ